MENTRGTIPVYLPSMEPTIVIGKAEVDPSGCLHIHFEHPHDMMYIQSLWESGHIKGLAFMYNPVGPTTKEN